MSNKPGNKILRIGLIQNGRIVEERLMRSAKPITIGHGLKKNTLVVPASDLPKSFKVFEPKDGGYLLYFTSKMSGRISLGDGVRTLEELAREGRAKKSGDGYVLEIHQKARGKLTFGEVTILFQFVTPPPGEAKAGASGVDARRLVADLEPFLGAVVAISAIVQIGFVVWLENQEFPPDELREAEIADRFVKIMVDSEPEEPEVPDEKPEPTEGEGEGEPQEKEEAPKPQPKPKEEKVEKQEQKPKTAEERAAAEAERRKRMAEKVRKSTILHEIGAVAGEGGNLADTLNDGAGSTTMQEAFEGSTGMKTAELGAEKSGVRSSGSSDAEASGSASGINDLGQTSGAKAAEEGVETGSKEETKVKAKIDIKGGGEPIGAGKLSASRISSVVRRGASGIQRCYERVLKQNPNEGGKLIITVTIGQAGRVTNVATKTGIGGGFASCVKTRVKSWRFPRPKGGDVMFNKTFVLSK